MNNNFVDIIVSLMQKKNISQTELSRISGITQSSISDWICGKYLPKKDKIEILAKVFNVSPSYLMGWQDDRASDLSATKSINIKEHNKEIGQRIKQMREQLGLSQEELAKRIGSSNRSTVSNYEQGNRTFKQSQIALFSKALGITPAYLMGLENDKALFYLKKDIGISVGDRICQLRIINNMTLEDLGNKVGVGKSTVRKWENGIIANMRIDKITKLASALGVTPAHLMSWNEETKCENVLDDDATKLFDLFNSLNSLGKEKAIGTLSDLVCIPRYTEKRES